MALTPGTRLGVYEITAQIGEGGMGQVYRGTDTTLGRQVAIKILPDAFASDAERMARFEREAKTLASLNHPNIAAIYGFEKSGGTHALVMELVEGDDLSQRITRGAIPVDAALPIAKQVAEALEAAHEQGIVHRDLKPANIKVRSDGTVKVLDFGLAKTMEPIGAMSASASMSPTITTPAMTQAGMILGTAAYMSPEQAGGQRVDKRTDIWAFGAVLYEMLVGRKAFAGETVSDILVSVLSRDVDWNALPPTLPSKARDLLKRCLQRDSAQRLRDIGDARIEITEVLKAGPALAAAETTGNSEKRRPEILTLGILGLGVLLGVVIGWAGLALLRHSPDDAPSWTGTRLDGPSVALSPRLSPDGKTLAFRTFVDGLAQVAVMNPESGNWTAVTRDRTRGYVSTISWSLDATRIYYTRFDGVPRGIYSVPALGGEERLILENAAGAEPLPDGSLLVARTNANRQAQMYRYWARDGRLDPLPGILMNSEGPSIRVFRDGSRAVFWGRSMDQASSDPRAYLYLMDIGRASLTRVPTDIAPLRGEGAETPLAILPDGASVAVVAMNGDERRVVAVPLNPSSRVRTLVNLQARGVQLDVGPDGSLFVTHGSASAEIVRFTASGGSLERINAFPNATLRRGQALHLPDGRTLAEAVVGGRSRLLVGGLGKDAIPFVETEEETSSPSALLGNEEVAFVVGSGDSRRIAIASLHESRILRRLQSVRAATMRALAASPDGRTLYYVDSGTVWSVPAEDGPPRKISRGDGVAVTPDGKQLIIQLIEAERIRWVKVALDNGVEHPIPIKSDIRFAPVPPGPGAVWRDGRIVLPIAVSDSWFWPPAIFDPNIGSVQRIPVPYVADFGSLGWTSEGKIIAAVFPIQASIWRFRPTPLTDK